MVDDDALTIYTDGSSYSRPRRGGAGVLFVHIAPDGSEIVEKKEMVGYKGATNNQMELYACIEGLKQAFYHLALNKVQRVIIRTDSQYITNNYLSALKYWSRSDWRNKEGRPIDNAVLWKDLKKYYLKLAKEKRVRVIIEWVHGHAKDPYNKIADKMAQSSAKGILNEPLFPVQVRKKKTSEITQVGSVGVCGQRITVYIVSAQLLPLQKINKYTYEVISKNSKYHGKKDIIYSEHNLKAGHTYYVVFSRNQNNPEIKKVIREISAK